MKDQGNPPADSAASSRRDIGSKGNGSELPAADFERGLPGEWLASEEWFEHDRRSIFHRHWLAVAAKDRLARPGDLATCEIAGESLLLLCDDRGEVRGFHNFCRHRGCRLVESRTGHCGATLRCPYHGWTYRTDGRLASAPNMSDVEGFDPASHGLIEVPLAAWGHQWFAHLGTPLESLQQWLAPLTVQVGPWLQAPLRCIRQTVYDVRANWKLLFENFSECYHCRFVHPRLNALTRFDTAVNDLDAGPILGGPMKLEQAGGSMSIGGRACGRRIAGIPAEQSDRVFYYTVFPNLFFSPHPDYLLVHRIYPRSAGQTSIECEWWFAAESSEEPGFDPQPAIDFWDEVNRQDWQVCEATQRGVSSPAYRPGPYSPLESMVRAFDRHYRERIAEDG